MPLSWSGLGNGTAHWKIHCLKSKTKKTHQLTKGETLAQAVMLEWAKETVKETMKVAIKTTSHKNNKMIIVVMVDPIKATKKRILLMRRPAIMRKNSNNSVGHCTRKEKLTK